ncbi:ABC transporter transmembrane domain-containing protein [Phaeobacter marinintestinus]|uniref:ABC transporter transmembrane domain-containing protein n=1 Tax=Falsiphaeobacter marinintestinus TaxID=1492905 RepID=UPI0011B6DBDF|nr:ABC transporter transmembrane domain-containing protein [Phaeobacter marinintestinus]
MLELYAAIWRVSGRRQIVLIVLSVCIAALAAAPLGFHKEIINLLTKGDIDQTRLFMLGAGMMGVILLSLALKWVMGYRSGILGEDVIRLLRARLITATASGDAQVPVGTLSTAVSAEAEDVGKFAGGAFSDPVVQIGTLISVIGFIASTQPGLGTIAVALIIPQVVIVLVSQRKVNTLVAERVRILRRSTDTMTAKSISDAEREILEAFDHIYDTRRTMFIWKLSSKFLLSVINGIGTVLVLMLGGWLVLKGRTDVGTVVAATMGLTRIQGPTAFLIAYYRQVSANRVKFELLRGLFPTG